MDVFFRNGKNAVLRKVNIMKREGQVRIPSGCAISAVISREGRRMTGEKIVESMIPMHDRSNGLGGGFAAYGIYPEYRDYQCTLQTDTEVMAYIADYLLRRQGLTLEETASVMAAPFWSTIEHMEPQEAERLTYLRKVFPSLLLTGPFSIILGFSGGLMALNDRLKLRSMVVGEKDDRVFISSEEAAIRVMEPDAENIWAPMGGEPVIVRLKEGTY